MNSIAKWWTLCSLAEGTGICVINPQLFHDAHLPHRHFPLATQTEADKRGKRKISNFQCRLDAQDVWECNKLI